MILNAPISLLILNTMQNYLTLGWQKTGQWMVNQTFYHTKANSVNYDHSRKVSFDIERTNRFASACPSSEDLDYAEISSNRHLVIDSNQLTSDQASTSSASPIEYSSESQILLEAWPLCLDWDFFLHHMMGEMLVGPSKALFYG